MASLIINNNNAKMPKHNNTLEHRSVVNYEKLIESTKRIKVVKAELIQALDSHHDSRSPLKELFGSWYFESGNLQFRLFDIDCTLEITQSKDVNDELSLRLVVTTDRVQRRNNPVAEVYINNEGQISSETMSTLESLTLEDIMKFFINSVIGTI